MDKIRAENARLRSEEPGVVGVHDHELISKSQYLKCVIYEGERRVKLRVCIEGRVSYTNSSLLSSQVCASILPSPLTSSAQRTTTCSRTEPS